MENYSRSFNDSMEVKKGGAVSQLLSLWPA